MFEIRLLQFIYIYIIFIHIFIYIINITILLLYQIYIIKYYNKNV